MLESSPQIRVPSTLSTLGVKSWAESEYTGNESEYKVPHLSTRKAKYRAESEYLNPSPSPSLYFKLLKKT